MSRKDIVWTENNMGKRRGKKGTDGKKGGKREGKLIFINISHQGMDWAFSSRR